MALLGNKEKLLSEFKPELESQLATLRGMTWPNGAVSASRSGGYRAHWIRDGLYVLKPFEYLGLHADVYRMIQVPMNIFHRYQEKIHRGIQAKPGANYQFISARYHPNNYNELESDWGHNQLDMFGLYLYEISDIIKKTRLPVFSNEQGRDDKYLVNKITRYLETLEWWKCPDFGVWEEGPELHASSIGAVLGGLLRLRDLNDTDLFFNHRQLELGRKTLDDLLPKESRSDSHAPNHNKPYDLAQLSLIWPFRVVNTKQEQAILKNIETYLVRDHGVVRYPYDAYWNAADPRIQIDKSKNGLELAVYPDDAKVFTHNNAGTEAQWPVGFAWLSIVYSKIAKRKFEQGERHEEEKQKSRYYLERLRDQAVKVGETKYFPELYVNGTPNINTPLSWTTAFFIVAVRAHVEIEDNFIPYIAP